MNKMTIPSLLIGTVMIALVFAFMPVQEASTVHTTILGQTGTHKVLSADNAVLTSDITLIDLKSGTVEATGVICIDAFDGGTTTTILVNLNINTDTTVVLIDNANTEGGACAEFTGKELVIKAGPASSTVDYSVSWTGI